MQLEVARSNILTRIDVTSWYKSQRCRSVEVDKRLQIPNFKPSIVKSEAPFSLRRSPINPITHYAMRDAVGWDLYIGAAIDFAPF